MAWLPPFRYPSPKQKTEGVEVASLAAERENPQIKRTNLPARLQADEIKQKTGIYEVILVNGQGLVTEGSRSNIFFVKNGGLFTPDLELVLPGITQSKIFEVALSNKITVSKTQIKLEDVANFDSAFICSTSNQVLPLNKLDYYNFKTNNPVIETISMGFQLLAKESLDKFSW